MREIAQDYKDIRFRASSLQAIQEAAETFVTETFHKSEMARRHAKRNTLHVEDIRFSRFMVPESLWVSQDRMWEKETFSTSKESKLDKKLVGPASVSCGDAEAGLHKQKNAAPERKNKRKQHEPSQMPRKEGGDTGHAVKKKTNANTSTQKEGSREDSASETEEDEGASGKDEDHEEAENQKDDSGGDM